MDRDQSQTSLRRDVRQRAAHALAVGAATVLFCWPAIWNGYPLLMADSAEYLRDGSPVLRMLLQPSVVRVVETRSEIYSLGILGLHRDVSAWPVVMLQAALLAGVLWLVVRSLVARRRVAVYLVPAYLGLVVALNVLTGVGWYASLVLPDVLGPVLTLCVYLLVFAAASLRGWERVAVAVIAVWCVGSHATHLVVSGGLCAVLGVAWLLRWRGMQRHGAGLLAGVGVVVLAAGAQVALHARIYHQASLFGIRPPFLMARLIADGPARTYLQEHCATLPWAICGFVHELPMTDDQFLWERNGIWMTATWQQRLSLQREEMPLARATLRAYPLQQAERSLGNFGRQLVDFGIYNYPDFNVWDAGVLNGIFPGLYARYHATRQSQNRMDEGGFRAVYAVVVAASVVCIVWQLPWVWRSGPERLQGLCVVVLFTVVANAFVTGVLSGVYARYQGRVVWLLPLLAAAMVYSYREAAQGRERGAA